MDHDWRPRCAPARDLVTPVPLDPAGVTGPTRHQARRGRWRQTTYGFHVPAGTDSTGVEQRVLEQSMRLGGAGAVTGWAALRMYGGAFFDGLVLRGRALAPEPVPLVSPRRLVSTEASVTSQVSLAGHAIRLVQGVRCVGAERAVVDEVLRRGDLREGVVVIDMACAARLTSLRRIRAYLDRHPRGRRLVLAALQLADEHSLSPRETRMRLVWVIDAGWPRPLCNAVVFGRDGERLGRPDLLDPSTGTYGEYDGALHRDRARHRGDVARLERFQRAGLEGFTMVAGDTAEDQLERMTRARARAAQRAPEQRRWTLEPPAWLPEPPDVSLDTELDLRGPQVD